MSASLKIHHGPKRLLPLWEGRAVLIGTGLTLTLFMAILLIFRPLIIRQAELRIYDLMLSGRVGPPISTTPVAVGIDEASLAAYGQWPWPRYRLARLVEKLHRAGAEVVALDFLMPEPDRTSPGVIVAERGRDGESPVVPGQDNAIDQNSLRLAEAISRGKTTLGFFFEFGASEAIHLPGEPTVPEGMSVTGSSSSISLMPEPRGTIRSISLLTAAAGAEGFTNAIHDSDGALRRVPLLLASGGEFYPSLSLSSLLLASADRHLLLSRDGSETILLWGSRRIPLDSHGAMLLDFRNNSESAAYISARTVLEGKVPEGSLRGKIVLVGAWAKGLGDTHLVPSGKSLNGLSIHAAVIDTILSGRFITSPGWAGGAELFTLMLLGTASSWLLSRPGFILSLATVAGGFFLTYWGFRELLVVRGLYLSPLLPMLTPVVIMTFLSLLKYGIEARKVRQRTRDLIDAQDTIIVSMSALTATRDKETGGHIERTSRYVELLARELSGVAGYEWLDDNCIELLAKSAPLHDIGKVGIPDEILNKQGPLTHDEFEIMKSHTLIGANALACAMKASGHPENHAFLQFAREMIAAHHERWDGSGYPLGLSGDAVPLAGRLMALADVYDALTSKRIYKRGFSHEEARKLIEQSSGTGFDPEVVAAFVGRNEDFLRISLEYADSGEESDSAEVESVRGQRDRILL